MSSIGQNSVSIDDSMLIAEKATTIADDILNRVEDLSSDSKLTPTEKIKLRQEYSKDLELYKLDVKQLQNINLPTTELDAAIGELTNFITPYFKNMDVTETVDRDQLTHVFNMFATADKNANQTFINMIKEAAEDAKKAGEDAQKSADNISDEVKDTKKKAEDALLNAQDSFNKLVQTKVEINNQITTIKNDVKDALNNTKVIDSKVTNLSNNTNAQLNTLTNGYQLVLDTVNNMDIGGRNYLLDSDITTGVFHKLSSSTKTSYFNGKKIAVSVEIEIKNVKSISSSSNNRVGYEAIWVGDNGKNYYPGTWKVFTNDDIGKSFNLRIGNYFDFTNVTFKDNESNECGALYVQGISADSIKVGKPKLEIGTKVTDWTPAPEDLAKETEITVMQGLIDQKVSNDQYQSDKTQTADLISQTVGDAINNLNVGGRNYILNSDFYITSGQKNVLSSVEPNEYSGKKITVSVDIEINNLKTIADSGFTRVGYEASFHASDNSTVYVGVWKNLTKSDIGKSFKYRAINNTYDLTKKTITSINNGNGALGGVYIQGITADSIKVGHPKLEIATKATDWSPAPEDFATSTEFDQISNAIKLKANSSDVTSQINVAVKGVQTDVTNKVSNLTTQINQTSDAIQLLSGTVGSRNLVYNATYEQLTGGFPTGWFKDSNGKAYFSTNQVSSYQGRGSIGILTDANSLGWIDVARSQPMKLAVDNNPDANYNVYSASAMIKCYNDAGKGNGRVLVNLAAYDNNNNRLEPYMQVWSRRAKETNSTWELVKVEGFQPPKGATRIAISFWVYGDQTHAMINQPMINLGKKAEPFKPDSANQATITESINNINLKVANADGSSAQVNINNNTILLDANKILLNGNTSIQNGTIGTAKIANAAINDAKISSLNGNKIIAGSITSKQLNANDIIANVINGKTINGITINTPKLNLGKNGILSEDWVLNQNTGWFQPKKGKGTTVLDSGVLRVSGDLSRWWNGNGSDKYWYGIGDKGEKIKNGSNSITDDYAPGYEKHDIVGPSGVLLRSYLDATGLYLNEKSTNTIMASLTQKGLETGGFIYAKQNSVVEKWFDAGVNTGTGIRIGYRAIQAHGSNDIYFNTDSSVGALTLHAKKFAASSQLSRKKDISPLKEEQAMKTIMNTDIYRYHYKDETESEPYNYSVIIDDIHEKSQYKTPEEFIIADRTGRNDGNAIGFLIQALKNANRRISALEEIINDREE